jgi:small-conductance mechanosensitive channel
MVFNQELTGAAVWAVPLLVFAGALVVGLVLRAILLRALRRWAKTTATRFDDQIVSALRFPTYFWVFNLAVIAAMQTVDLPGDRIDLLVRRVLAALLIVSVTIGISRLLAEMVDHNRTGDIATTGLLRTIVRWAVIAIGLLIALGTVGISIAPLLGALGIGGLAAGLALQPTLSNIFAGFQVAIGRQIRVGNRVRLASGEEGWVTDISWRTTTLRTPSNHLVLVPNSKFADTIVTNFSMPYPHSNVTLDINVAYDSDARAVEAILRDEAKQAIAAIPVLESAFEPVVRLQALGESALRFQVVLQVKNHDEQFEIWGELQQRFFARLRREGIVMPFPARDVYLHGNGADGTIAAAIPKPREVRAADRQEK